MDSWRYLTAEGVHADEGLAVDEAIMWRYGRGEEASSSATLRLYSYRPHCALVGRYQAIEEEVNVEFCRQHGVQLGRRPTGGGAIIMGPGQLGIAIAASTRPHELPRGALKRYAGGVIAGLARLGITAHFRSKNDLEVGGRKIAGLGLYLDQRGAMLFHASVLVELDVALMLKVLRIPGAKFSDKAVARVEERVTTISHELRKRTSIAEIRSVIAHGIADAFEVDLGLDELDSAEAVRAAELASTLYRSKEWIFQQSPRRDARGTSLLKTPEGLLRIFVGVHGEIVKTVLVTGDFNILPPGVTRLEAALRWCRADRERIYRATTSTLTAQDLGVSPTEVAEAVWQAAARGLALQGSSHPVREGSCYFPEPADNAPSPPATSACEESQ